MGASTIEKTPIEFKRISHLTNSRSIERTRVAGIVDFFTCDICKKQFKQEKSMINHMETKHNMKCDFIKDYVKCVYCSKQYANRNLLQKHMKCHGKHSSHFSTITEKSNFQSYYISQKQAETVNCVSNAHAATSILLQKQKCTNMLNGSMSIG